MVGRQARKAAQWVSRSTLGSYAGSSSCMGPASLAWRPRAPLVTLSHRPLPFFPGEHIARCLLSHVAPSHLFRNLAPCVRVPNTRLDGITASSAFVHQSSASPSGAAVFAQGGGFRDCQPESALLALSGLHTAGYLARSVGAMFAITTQQTTWGHCTSTIVGKLRTMMP